VTRVYVRNAGDTQGNNDINDAAISLDDQYIKTLQRNHIHPRIAVITIAIFHMGNPSPIELARKTGRTPQTITDVLNRMEKLGLINKVINENKRNSYTIQLTAKGLKIIEKIRGINVFSKVVSALTEEERRQLMTCIQKMQAQIDILKL
jgi:DNA-binding MarR family transcriptional regulator